MVQAQPVVCKCDLELVVERQERFEQVLLVQRQSPLNEPLRRLVVRKEDVVHVYPDAGRNARQDFKKLVTDVAAKLYRVT